MRRAALAIVAGLVSWPLSAAAQTSSTAIEVEQFHPGPGTSDVFAIHGTEVLPQYGWQVGLFYNYAHDPLLVRMDGDEAQDILRYQSAFDIVAAYGLVERLELGIIIPIMADQGWTGSTILGMAAPSGIETAGLGDVRLVPRARLWDSGKGLTLSASAPIILPIGDQDSFLGHGSAGIEPRAALAYAMPNGVRVLANAGVRFRSEKERFANVVVGNEIVYGAAAHYPLPGKPVALAASLGGSLGLSDFDAEELPLELLAGGEYTGIKGVKIVAGGGPGLSRGYGAPDFRVFVGVTYQGEPGEKAAPIVHREEVTCANGPEDEDGFEDDDGCAEPDNDGDGIADADDMCPNVAETVNGERDEDGCPETPMTASLPVPQTGDSDGDGIDAALDACPDEPEDMDGFEDGDGCPEDDNDGDGIADADDKCPVQAETINGRKDDDGCPDRGKSLVKLTSTSIVILQKVYFATNRARIRSRSNSLLNQVAATLKANPSITKVRVEGHTDSRADDDYNLKLSQRRADAVVKFLVEKGGIDPARLVPQGYGESRPIADNKTSKGREENRRVEFKIIEVNGQPTGDADGDVEGDADPEKPVEDTP